MEQHSGAAFTRRTFIGLSGGVALTGMLAACSGTSTSASAGSAGSGSAIPGASAALISAAEKEGAVMLYAGNWADSTNAVVKAFEGLYPKIKVQVYTTDSGTLRQRLLAEDREGQTRADVYTDTDPGTLNNFAKQGLFMNYKVASDDKFAASAKDPGYWYPLRIAVAGMAWNSSLVTDEQSKALAQWSGATDMAFKGKAGVVTPTSGGGIAYLPWYTWDKLYGDGFFQKIGALKPRIYASIDPGAAALAAGDIAVLFGASETGLYPLYAKGAPIKWSLPSPGVGTPTGQAVVNKAPHPNAAKLYQAYSFSEQGYKIWQTYTGVPAWAGMKDQRKVGQESWYKPPKSYYNYNLADVTNQMDRINNLFTRSVK